MKKDNDLNRFEPPNNGRLTDDESENLGCKSSRSIVEFAQNDQDDLATDRPLL
jgi:hypothetical protein